MAETRSSFSESSSAEHVVGLTSDDVDEFELHQRLEKIRREIVELTFENSVFESNLERKKSEPITYTTPSMATTNLNSSQTTPTGSNQDLTTVGGSSRGERYARKRSKSRSTQGDFRIALTLDQKVAVIVSEHDHMKNEENRREAANEKKLDQLESDLEWMDVEMADFDLAITDLLKNKDASIDRHSRKLIGEKIDRYLIERLKARESLINKLRDRSSGLRRQITRLDAQLRQKEETGETLNEVDFNQLKIENKQYLDKIDEKNIDLIQRKRQVGRVTQSLNRQKDELQKQTKELIDTQQRIDKQRTIHEHAEQEIVVAKHDQFRVTRVHHHLAEQTENYQVPEVLDYVKKKALLYNLERDCAVWERKLEIASMALQQSKQQWQALQHTAQHQNHMANWNHPLDTR